VGKIKKNLSARTCRGKARSEHPLPRTKKPDAARRLRRANSKGQGRANCTAAQHTESFRNDSSALIPHNTVIGDATAQLFLRDFGKTRECKSYSSSKQRSTRPKATNNRNDPKTKGAS